MSPPRLLRANDFYDASGLNIAKLFLLDPNIIELVRENDGTIFSIQRSRSPTSLVESIILKINTTIPPIPEMTKCINIVTV